MYVLIYIHIYMDIHISQQGHHSRVVAGAAPLVWVNYWRCSTATSSDRDTEHRGNNTTYFTPRFSISHLPVLLRHACFGPLLVFALVPLPLSILCRRRPRTLGHLPWPVQHHHGRLGQAGQVGQAVGRRRQRSKALLGGGGGRLTAAGRAKTVCMKITSYFGGETTKIDQRWRMNCEHVRALKRALRFNESFHSLQVQGSEKNCAKGLESTVCSFFLLGKGREILEHGLRLQEKNLFKDVRTRNPFTWYFN